MSSFPKYLDTVGNTPLLDITSMVKSPKCEGIRVLGKAEFMNPGFSMKDRIVNHILRRALQDGKIQPGGTVVCASSGNTGASVAMLGAILGLKAASVFVTGIEKRRDRRSIAFA